MSIRLSRWLEKIPYVDEPGRAHHPDGALASVIWFIAIFLAF
jgi:hypothetical protein